jgi:hypothetical protein
MKKFRGSGWVARIDERLGFGEVGLLVGKSGDLEPPEALRCSLDEVAQSTTDYLSTGKAFRLTANCQPIARWYPGSQTLVLDLTRFGEAKRSDGARGVSMMEYHGEVILSGA